MLKVSKLLTLLVAISCTYASDKQNIFNINHNSDNNMQNITNNDEINKNQTHVKEKKKTPEYIKNFSLTQNELNLIESYLLSEVPQSEIDKLKNKDLNNKPINIIDFVNKLIKREKVHNKKYNYDNFFNRTNLYGKWFEINSVEELNNNCRSVIQNVIRRSFTTNRPLLSNTEELEKIDGKKITEEINDILSRVQTAIKDAINKRNMQSLINNIKTIPTEITKDDVESIVTKYVLPIDLRDELVLKKISNIRYRLARNTSSPELFKAYFSVLRNILVQYGMCYKHFFENNNKYNNNITVLANEHFSPFTDTISYKTNCLLYEICNVEDKNKIKININNNFITLEKKISLIPADNSKLYYVFNEKNKYKYKSLECDDNPNKLKQLQNKKTLLYINYLLHYISFKIDLNYQIINIYNRLFYNRDYYLNNGQINNQEKDILNIIGNKMEVIIKNNDGKIDNKKKDDLHHAIWHYKSNNILNGNGDIIKISGSGDCTKQITALIDIFRDNDNLSSTNSNILNTNTQIFNNNAVKQNSNIINNNNNLLNNNSNASNTSEKILNTDIVEQSNNLLSINNNLFGTNNNTIDISKKIFNINKLKKQNSSISNKIDNNLFNTGKKIFEINKVEQNNNIYSSNKITSNNTINSIIIENDTENNNSININPQVFKPGLSLDDDNAEENKQNKFINKKRKAKNTLDIKSNNKKKKFKGDKRNNNKEVKNIIMKNNTKYILLDENKYNTKLNNNKQNNIIYPNNNKLIRPTLVEDSHYQENQNNNRSTLIRNIFTDEQNNILNNRISNSNFHNNDILQTSRSNQTNNNNTLLTHLFIPYNTQMNSNISNNVLNNNDNNSYHHYTLSNQQFLNLLNNNNQENNELTNNNISNSQYILPNSQSFNLLHNNKSQSNK